MLSKRLCYFTGQQIIDHNMDIIHVFWTVFFLFSLLFKAEPVSSKLAIHILINLADGTGSYKFQVYKKYYAYEFPIFMYGHKNNL